MRFAGIWASLQLLLCVVHALLAARTSSALQTLQDRIRDLTDDNIDVNVSDGSPWLITLFSPQCVLPCNRRMCIAWNMYATLTRPHQALQTSAILSSAGCVLVRADALEGTCSLIFKGFCSSTALRCRGRSISCAAVATAHQRT